MNTSHVTCPLSHCISLYGGGTPSKDNLEYWNGTIPWASVKDLKTTKLSRTQDSITELGLSNSSSKMVKAGTIIIATRMAVGRVTIADIDVAINQDLKAIKCSEKIDVDYLFYFLFSQESNFNKVASGATVKGIKINHILDMRVPLPPIAVQKKIAEILDTANSLRQKDQQLVEHYTALSQSLFLEMFGDPITNPMGWDVFNFDRLVADGCPLTYGIVQPGDKFPDGVAVVRPVDLTSRYIELRTLKKINPDISSKFQRTILKGKEILLSVRGSVGVVSFALPELCGANVTRGIVPIWMNESLMSTDFAFNLLQTNGLQNMIKRLAKGATLIQINLKDLREMKVVCPPITLQNQFDERIEAIEKQKQQAQVNLEKSEVLFNSLLQRAFKGELTVNKAA